MADPIHLQPTAPLAERVLLPGDPGRALRLAQQLLDEPRMFNHNRGLWGYSGTAQADGEPLTIQATGMGGPSAAIVVAELVDLGAGTLLRVGTCGALVGGLELGSVLAVAQALCADGTSRALGAGPRAVGDPALLARLTATGVPETVAVTSDLFYDGPDDAEEQWARDGAAVVEMEAAALFALAARRGVAAGALLAVTDIVVPQRRRIDADGLAAAELRLGELALAALAGTTSGRDRSGRARA